MSSFTRRAGLAACILGSNAAACMNAPRMAAGITITCAALAAATILTALYAPEKYSARAFHLLRWTAVGIKNDGGNE
jgi:hypothetical protein